MYNYSLGKANYREINIQKKSYLNKIGKKQVMTDV